MSMMTAWAKEEDRIAASERLAKLERIATQTAQQQGVTLEELLRRT
jgi:hypothetical protein